MHLVARLIFHFVVIAALCTLILVSLGGVQLTALLSMHSFGPVMLRKLRALLARCLLTIAVCLMY